VPRLEAATFCVRSALRFTDTCPSFFPCPRPSLGSSFLAGLVRLGSIAPRHALPSRCAHLRSQPLDPGRRWSVSCTSLSFLLCFIARRRSTFSPTFHYRVSISGICYFVAGARPVTRHANAYHELVRHTCGLRDPSPPSSSAPVIALRHLSNARPILSPMSAAPSALSLLVWICQRVLLPARGAAPQTYAERSACLPIRRAGGIYLANTSATVGPPLGFSRTAVSFSRDCQRLRRRLGGAFSEYLAQGSSDFLPQSKPSPRV